jgi:hypothetical protein
MSDNLTDQIEGNARLEYTLSVRESIVKHLLTKGPVPEDKADKMLLISALDGMDRTILSRAKIKLDSKTNDIAANSNSIIANLLQRISPKQIASNNYNPDLVIPVLSTDIELLETVDDEVTIGTIEETFDNFTKRMDT